MGRPELNAAMLPAVLSVAHYLLKCSWTYRRRSCQHTSPRLGSASRDAAPESCPRSSLSPLRRLGSRGGRTCPACPLASVAKSRYAPTVIVQTHRCGLLRREVAVREDVDPARALGERRVLVVDAVVPSRDVSRCARHSPADEGVVGDGAAMGLSVNQTSVATGVSPRTTPSPPCRPRSG